MEKSNFRFAIKSLNDEGSFSGLASVYNNEDLQGDVVAPGAFAKTIRDRQGEVPLLWQHDPREPIGIAKISDSVAGLQVDGSLVLASPVAAKAYALLKNRVLRGLSIGFDALNWDQLKGGVRKLTELRLWEISLVTFAANPEAQVLAVKSNVDLEPAVRKLQALLAECRKSF